MFGLVRLLRRRRRGAEAGFTLLELLVVLAILALLAGLVGPRVLEQLAGAKSDSARIQIHNIEAALDLYRLDVGRYPTESQGLKALMEKPAEARRWRGPYLKSSDGLIDPWGEQYKYRPLIGAKPFEIVTLGSDKTEGGEGEKQDVHN